MDPNKLLTDLKEKIEDKIHMREQADADIALVSKEIEVLRNSNLKRSVVLSLELEVARENLSIQLLRERYDELSASTQKQRLKAAQSAQILDKKAQALEGLNRLVIVSKSRLDEHCTKLLDEFHVPEERLQMALAERDSFLVARPIMPMNQEREHEAKIRIMRMRFQALQRQLKEIQARLSKRMHKQQAWVQQASVSSSPSSSSSSGSSPSPSPSSPAKRKGDNLYATYGNFQRVSDLLDHRSIPSSYSQVLQEAGPGSPAAAPNEQLQYQPALDPDARMRNHQQQQPELIWDQEEGKRSRSPPLCDCRRPAVLRTIRKEGRNQGRHFWGCAAYGSSTTGSCRFFRIAGSSEM